MNEVREAIQLTHATNKGKLVIDADSIKATANTTASVGGTADTFEIGLNYIIDGFNLRLFSVYGNNEFDSDGPGKDPDDISYFTFGVQLQL